MKQLINHFTRNLGSGDGVAFFVAFLTKEGQRKMQCLQK